VPQAHTMGSGEARNAAEDALYRCGLRNEGDHDYVSDVHVKYKDCLRWSAHKFKCVGDVEWEAEDGYEYDDGTTSAYCVGTITVRYVSRYSHRKATRVAVGDDDCG